MIFSRPQSKQILQQAKGDETCCNCSTSDTDIPSVNCGIINGCAVFSRRARDNCMAEQTWKVDMHSHTRLSRDSLNEPRRLVDTAAQKGLQALCVTDHNGLANALALSRLPDLPITVVPSEE